jgi:hypothetical protein
MAIIFTVLVVLGFGFHLLSAWSVNYATRIAWTCWFIASFLWAAGRLAV